MRTILLILTLTAPCPVCCQTASLARCSPPPSTARATTEPVSPPQEITLLSEAPSGDPVVDRIWFTFYPAAPGTPSPAPAVVMLHALAEGRPRMLMHMGAYLARHGIASALMTLPYHRRRVPPGQFAGAPFTDSDVRRMIQAAGQSAADVSTVVTWLSYQPGIDAHRIGVVGISLGACVAHLAMGKDARLSAGVAVLGGGNLERLRHASLVFRLRKDYTHARLLPELAEALRQVDPLTYADRNRPRKVLMIEAARDLLMPPRNARVLWEALGRPPIIWVDTNHFGPVLGYRSVIRATATYLQEVWRENPPAEDPPPVLHVPTLKLGMIWGLDSYVTPALQWQSISFVTRRDHMSLLHVDLGWTGRGPFAGLAATVNGFLDLGAGRRLNGRSFRPYVSVHVVF